LWLQAQSNKAHPSDAQLEALIAWDHLEQVGGNR
jgi:hypothetical protein